jgi:hypothetical protein
VGEWWLVQYIIHQTPSLNLLPTKKVHRIPFFNHTVPAVLLYLLHQRLPPFTFPFSSLLPAEFSVSHQNRQYITPGMIFMDLTNISFLNWCILLSLVSFFVLS